jgi:2',3'-cyclic-nucleotide 2'-phosphodiesterase (5'-nucleotidase family)
LPEPTAVPPSQPAEAQTLTILYTNDEHGWMEGMEAGEGAAELMGLWQEQEGYSLEDGRYLILSGGDMWTGPAISTWFDGESMVEVMNAMGYDAAAIGNHEFDFGLEQLQVRLAQAEFPVLSANLRYAADGTTPIDLGILPYAIIPADGASVGVIGLTTTRTPRTTNPNNVAAFVFLDYETAVREIYPQVKAEGADVVVVNAHACRDEIEALATAVSDLDIQLIGGGHCNELFAKERGDIVVMEGGYHMGSYAHATFAIDPETGAVTVVAYGTEQNQGGTAVPEIAAIVGKWHDAAAEELSVVIGYTEEGFGRRSPEMQALITDAWLAGYPAADAAITNLGGMRADIPPGDITLESIITVMPFDNVLIAVTLSREQLVDVLNFARDDAISGAFRQNGDWLLDKTGEPVDPAAAYTLLVNDFMYAGGDGYDLLARFDPDAYNTAIDWRQPVIDWFVNEE